MIKYGTMLTYPPLQKERLYRILKGQYCGGVITNRKDIIVRTAPCFFYMVGIKIKFIEAYKITRVIKRRKGWERKKRNKLNFRCA